MCFICFLAVKNKRKKETMFYLIIGITIIVIFSLFLIFFVAGICIKYEKWCSYKTTEENTGPIFIQQLYSSVHSVCSAHKHSITPTPISQNDNNITAIEMEVLLDKKVLNTENDKTMIDVHVETKENLTHGDNSKSTFKNEENKDKSQNENDIENQINS